MEHGWRIELLGDLRVRRGDQVISRFPKQLVASLLAYLAAHPQYSHARDVLLEALCPELGLEEARNSLRVALHLLRRLLEPPDAPEAEPLLIVDRRSIRLNPAVFTTDLAEFEAAVRAAARARRLEEQLSSLSRAVELYRGELLAGFTEEWVFTERRHRAEQYLEALHRLVSGFEQEGELERALEYGRLAVLADPRREEAHYELMRLYAAAGQPSATVQQYQELERLLREELNEKPSAAARALAEELHRNARTIVVARSPRGVEPSAAPPRLDDLDHPLQPPAPPAPAGEAVVSGSPAPSPPEVSPAPAPRLPPQFTRFFGREEEIARVTELLSSPVPRLLTITGPGGSGKTRLAIAAVGRLVEVPPGIDRAPKAVVFVPLADVTEPARIPEAIADALRLERTAEVEAVERVIGHMAAQPWLLVLDNFEHLVAGYPPEAGGGALWVRTLLERVPTLTCLVTSRQRLAITGEQEFALLPLPTPRVRGQQADLLTPDPWLLTPLMQFPSVQLFVDRARAVRDDFALTRENGALVAELCDRLDGLPLALELAAARIAVLSPREMLEQLQRRFDFLVTRQRDAPARHRTLRIVIEGSYRLLDPELQRFFARLSVFRGGWTLEAAQAVCYVPDALDYLEQLRDCSLLTVEESEGEGRYRLLETLREYAWEQLGVSGERDAIQARHREWYLQLAERGRAAVSLPEQREWLLRLEREIDNFRAALGACHEVVNRTGDRAAAEAGLRLAAALDWFWISRGYLREGLDALQTAMMDGADLPADVRAPALDAAGNVAGTLDASLAYSFRQQSRDAHERVLQAAGYPAKLGEEGARQKIATTLLSLVVTCFWLEDLDATWAYGLEARRLMEESGDPVGLARVLELTAGIPLRRGDLQTARALLEERLEICRKLGAPSLLVHALGGMGHLERDEGNFARAKAYYQESLMLRRDLGDKFALAQSLYDLAVLAGKQGQAERATRLLGGAEVFCETLGTAVPAATAATYHATVAEGRAAMGDAAFAAAWAEGRAMSLDEAVACALEESRTG
jgi:predicted ATPase/DNA-binding SARP family transcriptional activator